MLLLLVLLARNDELSSGYQGGRFYFGKASEIKDKKGQVLAAIEVNKGLKHVGFRCSTFLSSLCPV